MSLVEASVSEEHAAPISAWCWKASLLQAMLALLNFGKLAYQGADWLSLLAS